MSFFQDKVVWITGASSGLGEGLAKEFAENKAKLILSARRESELERVKKDCAKFIPEENILVLPLDVTELSTINSEIQKVIQKFGRIDILVNNAGLYEEEPFDLLTFESWQKMLSSNLNGLFLMSKAVLPSMKSHNFGRIINMSSNTIWLGTPYLVRYQTGKMGINGLTRSLGREVGQFG